MWLQPRAMAIVTARPTSGQDNCICRVCHRQYLEELSVETFCKKGRYGDEREYVVTELEIGLCAGCQPPFWQSIGEGIVSLCGGDAAVTYKLAWTNAQHAEMITCAPVAAVADAPGKVQNANVQMSNMRGNGLIDKDGCVTDCLYKSAVHTIWPYVATLKASGEANRSSSMACCASRALHNSPTRRCVDRKSVV